MPTLAPIRTAKLTAEQYFQLGEDPPGVHLELIDGEIIVSPSPNRSHAEIVLALAFILESHLRKKKKRGKLYLDTDVLLSRLTVRRPDIAYYSPAKLAQMTGDRLTLPPDLCIEVISPSNPEDDRINKFNLYQKHRIGHYWLFDPEERLAECFALRGAAYILAAAGRDVEKVSFPPFANLAISLAEVWSAVGM